MFCSFKYFVLLFYLTSVQGRGLNGGFSCAGCTIVFGIAEQLAVLHNETILVASLKLCDMLPGFGRTYCRDAVQALEPALTNLKLIKTFTPDLFCYGIGICYPDNAYCHLFPKPEVGFNTAVQQTKAAMFSSYNKNVKDMQAARNQSILAGYNLCKLPGVRQVCEALEADWMRLEPALDADKDKFSLVESARGSNWRGKDCIDWDKNAYPGRVPYEGDDGADYNCNGVWGRDPVADRSYEEQLCLESKARGILYLGDSVGAHFHFPEVWINPTLISSKTLHNYTKPLLDELDWPQIGFATGFKNTTQPLLIQGITDSIYLRMRTRNRCNHRDYQNLSRNGASSYDIIQYMKGLARNKTRDKPALVFYGVFGNDICNRFADTIANMTPPAEFRKNVMEVLRYLDSTLPDGSHVVLIGLVDGGFIYPTMANRLHPLGAVSKNIRYQDVYKWFECMEIGPCVGWMTSNSTLRKITSKASQTLSKVLQKIAATQHFSSFDVHYLDNPLHEVVWRWQQAGKPLWELIDPIDSLHPSQAAQPSITEVLWNHLTQKIPQVLGKENPNNFKIEQLFGDQGGH